MIEGEAYELVAARQGPDGLNTARFRPKLGILNLQTDRVQPDYFGGRANIQADVDASVECIAIRNNGEIHRVTRWPGRSIQTQFRWIQRRRGERRERKYADNRDHERIFHNENMNYK